MKTSSSPRHRHLDPRWVTRNKKVSRTAVSIFLALATIVSSSAIANATTLVVAYKPTMKNYGYSRATYYSGSVARNDLCNALACNDSAGIQIRRSGTWTTVNQTVRERSNVSGVWCGKVDAIRNVHSAVFLVAAESGGGFGIDVLGSGGSANWSGTDGKWIIDNKFSSVVEKAETGMSYC